MRVLFLALALIASAQAVAQQKCYEWRADASLPWVKKPADSAQQFVSNYCAAQPGSPTANGRHDCQVTGFGLASTGFPNYQFTRSNKITSGCPTSCTVGNATQLVVVTSRESPSGCPSCGTAGSSSDFTGEGTSAPSTTCQDGCLYSRKNGAAGRINGGTWYWAGTYKSLGTACAASDAGTQAAEEGEDGQCDPTGAICVDKGTQNKNCGIYNGSRVCVESVPPGGCVSYPGGGVACKGPSGGTSPPETPPAPNNGTPGEPAEADATVSSPGGSTVNYYSSTTVSGSSTAPSTGVPNSGVVSNPTGSDEGEDSDGDGDADGGGTGGGDGGGGDGGECDGPDCNAGVPTLEEIGTLSDAFGGFWEDLEAVPIVAATGDVAVSFGAGACPNWQDSIEVFGHSWEMNFNGICTTWADVSSVLSVVMLVFWGFVAFRILFSA